MLRSRAHVPMGMPTPCRLPFATQNPPVSRAFQLREIARHLRNTKDSLGHITKLVLLENPEGLWTSHTSQFLFADYRSRFLLGERLDLTLAVAELEALLQEKVDSHSSPEQVKEAKETLERMEERAKTRMKEIAAAFDLPLDH